MRTNVSLDEDVYDQVTLYASARRISLGKAIGELIRKANAAPPPPSRLVTSPNGLRVFPDQGGAITQEMVNRAREEDSFA